MSNFPITKSLGQTTSVDLEARTFEAWVSVESLDRDKEFVPISALTANLPIYMKNPVLLLGHQHKTLRDSLPIGKCLKIEPKGNRLWAKFYVTKNPVGDEVLTLLDEAIISGLSCGFVPIKAISNPSDHQLPAELRGKGCKRYYSECELVEISLLSIPSNRDSLVIHAEKGSKVASLILKEFDGEDVSLIVKEWLQEEEDKSNIDMVVKEWLGEKETLTYTLKDLYNFREQDHPRDEFGMFSSKPSTYLNGYPEIKNDVRHAETQRKLDEMVSAQHRIVENTQSLKDQNSWGHWAKKWLVTVGAIGGIYLGFKHIMKSPEARAKIVNWLENKATKGAEPVDEVDKFLAMLDTTKMILDKGKELGLTETPDYQKLQKVYDKTVEMLSKNVGSSANISTKEMSAEEFKEEEHPRAKDGKFANKNGSQTSTGAKVATVVTSAGVATALAIGGIKVAKTAAVMGRFNNRAAIKNSIENIMSSCSNPHPNKKALEDIVNLSVVDKMDNKVALNKRERDFVDYVANTDQFQKDLAATFGHLEGGGTQTVVMHSGWVNTLEVLKAQDVNNLDTFRKSQMVYMRDDNFIHMNTSVFDYVMKQQKDFGNPKQLLIHEYAHSVAANNPDILLKHYGDYENKLKALIGQKIDIKEADSFGNLGMHIKGTVEGISIEKTNIGEAVKFDFSHTFTPSEMERLNKINQYAGQLHIRLENGKEKTIPMSMMPIAQLWAQLSGHIFQLDHIKTPREIYALQDLDEYFAVLAESGGKL